MKRHTLPVIAAATLVAVAAVWSPVRAQDEEDPTLRYVIEVPTEVDIEALLAETARRINVPIFIDEQVRGSIKFISPVTLDYRMLRAVLALYEVQLIHEQIGTRQIIKVCPFWRPARPAPP